MNIDLMKKTIFKKNGAHRLLHRSFSPSPLCTPSVAIHIHRCPSSIFLTIINGFQPPKKKKKNGR